MMSTNHRDPISNISFNTRKALETALNQDDNWKKLFACVADTLQLGKQQVVFERDSSPAKRILDTLDIKLCTVEILIALLRSCNLGFIANILTNSGIVILRQPSGMISCIKGQAVKLLCEAVSSTLNIPSYQWIKDNIALPGEIHNVLLINCVTENDVGIYKCIISNEVYSSECEICVNTGLDSEDIPSPVVQRHLIDGVQLKDNRTAPSSKVALIMGNYNYEYLSDLRTVKHDAETVGQILTKLGFDTIYLINYKRMELLEKFHVCCNQLQPNSYVFVYYGGHGFELREKYIQPVDCLEKYKWSDVVSEKLIMQLILNKKPSLFVMLLDMCLAMPSKEENPFIYNEVAEVYNCNINRNLLCGYATTSELLAYERTDLDHSVYMKYLKDWLPKNEPIADILLKINEEIEMESSKAADLQRPSLLNCTNANFYLTTPVATKSNY